MPNPHYQRVLEQDEALPAPLRWLSRATSSWWTIGVLGVFVVGYVFVAHAPISGKYLWQSRMFDTTQHATLTWWPLLVAAWLLAIVLVWSAMRRLPWRIDNLGAFVAVLGLVMILVSQSWAFRSQSLGIAAVPITASTGNAQTDAMSLNYTTRYGDTHDRVLVVMVSGAAPLTIPIHGIPRWNDAAGDAMPNIKLHDDPKLASAIGYGTRITTSAYIAHGELTETSDGKQTAQATPTDERDLTNLPYPNSALLALDITADLEDGSTQTTTAWLPFEPEGTDSLVPKKFFPIEGLGSVGLAFRPASKKLPFALGASHSKYSGDLDDLKIRISDADQNGRLLQPIEINLNTYSRESFSHRTSSENGGMAMYLMDWIGPWSDVKHPLLIKISTGTSNPFILAGMITFALGVFLDRLIDWLSSRPKRSQPASAPDPPDKSPTPTASP